MSETRRESLKLLALLSAVVPVHAEGQDSHHPDSHASDQPGYQHSPYKPPVIPPYEPKTFTAGEAAIVTRVVDLIMPETETPGAVRAGVPQYIDHAAAANPDRAAVIRRGAAWMDEHAHGEHGRRFVDLEPAQQIAMLTLLAGEADFGNPRNDGAAFFRILKDLTVDGYYTSYAGLVEELNYSGNQMLRVFPGCADEH